MSTQKDRKQISFRPTPTLYDQIQAESVSRQMTVQDMITEALTNYFQTEPSEHEDRRKMPRRVIDPKYHAAREGIVKTSTGELIPGDEPLILFRARDLQALPALLAYKAACQAAGCEPYQLASIQERIEAFQQFSMKQPARMKQPGCTRGK